MSTAADILGNIGRLVTAVSELLATDTVKALVDMARKVGIGSLLKTLLQALSQALGLVIKWIKALEHVSALQGFLDALGPAFEEAKALTDNTSKEELKEQGFDALAPMADAARVLVELMDKLRKPVKELLEGLLPARELESLRKSVEGLDATLHDLQKQLDAPAGSSTQGALAEGVST
jgi:hypothetical protein